MLRGLHGRAALTESIQILGRGIDLRFHARHLRFESLQSRWDIVPAGRDRDAMARYPLWRGSHPRLRPQSWRRCDAVQDVAFPQGHALHLLCAEGSEPFESLPVAIRNLGPWQGIALPMLSPMLFPVLGTMPEKLFVKLP